VPPIGRGEFEDAIEQLEPVAVARFAADLYRSRGATVEYTDRRMRVEDGDRVREFVVPEAVASTDRGVAVDPAALHRLLLYGVDRTPCAALVERHLGRPPRLVRGWVGNRGVGRADERRTAGPRSRRDSSEDSVQRVAEDDGPWDPGDRSGRRAAHFRGRPSALVAVLAVVLAVVLVAVFPAGLPGAGDGGESAPVSPAEPAPVEPSTGDVAAAAERAALVDGTLANGLEPVVTPGSERADLPPGANASDTTNGASVAERRVVRRSNRSHRPTLVVR
jgi:hypothetical protein